MEKHKILVIDDNINIYHDFASMLRGEESDQQLEELQSAVFGKPETVSSPQRTYEVVYANQGKLGTEMLKDALDEDCPFKMAFVDMRMPPGWDGLETTKQLWAIDPRLQVVICTAYSDYSWQQITQELDRPEDFLILKKPFDKIEVSQLAASLTEKWLLAREAKRNRAQLEALVDERTNALAESHARLEKTNNDLSYFNKMAVGRELRMIEMKKEVNALCRELGRDEAYP